MKTYIIFTTRNTQVEVTEEQRNAILKALAEDRPYIQLAEQDTLLMVKSIVSIVPAEQVEDEEQERLALNGKFKCKYGVVHWVSGENGGCGCWEQKKDESRELAVEKSYKLISGSPQSIQDGLKALANKMGNGLDGLTDDELLDARAEDGAGSVQKQIKRSLHR